MMNTFLSMIARSAVALPVAIFVLITGMLGWDQTFFMSFLYSMASGGFTYMTLGAYNRHRFLKKHRLTKKEYKYIKKNLNEASSKIKRLQKALFSIGHIRSLKQRVELLRMVKNIHRLSKREPKRFYKAEEFYFSHLDSALELTEKYAFLSSQPKTNRELEQSLYETQDTLKDLTKLVEKDLYYILSDDINNLHFEIDVAKQSIKKSNAIPDESRRLK